MVDFDECLRRITIRSFEFTNNYGELTSFDVDPEVATLRDVADRIHADPLLYCKTARIGLRLSPYEDDVTGVEASCSRDCPRCFQRTSIH